MPDNPNKRGPADRKQVSQQPHEQAHQRRKINSAPKNEEVPGKKKGPGQDKRTPPVTREDTEG